MKRSSRHPLPANVVTALSTLAKAAGFYPAPVFTLHDGAVDELHLFMRGILVASIMKAAKGFTVWRSNLKEATAPSQKEAIELALVGARKAFLSACRTGTFEAPLWTLGGLGGFHGVGCGPIAPRL